MPTPTPEARTYCQLWRITQDQYHEVKAQEGSWYTRELHVGHLQGLPILTFTHAQSLPDPIAPSASYLRTIVRGLHECHTLSESELFSYLQSLAGISGQLSADTLRGMLF
jgi:hypothetical protein